MLLEKKDKDEQVLLAKDQAWMELSSDSDQEINANMVFMTQIEKVLSNLEASSSSADEKISKKRIEKANQQSKDFKNQNKDLQHKYDVLKNQATTFEMDNKELNEQLKVLIEKNDDLLAQTKRWHDVNTGSSSRTKISYKIDKDKIAQKKVNIAFENADSSLRVELIPSKIKYANKVVLNFHK
nr:hypothetical protein [Tanacetum cinerariifolium]